MLMLAIPNEHVETNRNTCEFKGLLAQKAGAVANQNCKFLDKESF
jgi:hypothetical protein